MNEMMVNKKVWFMAGAFLLIGCLIWLFMSMVKPMQQERQEALEQLEYEQSQVAGIQQQVESQPMEIIESSMFAQRQLPVRPLVDQLLLTFARAEGIADVYILSIDVQDEVEDGFSTFSPSSTAEVEQEEQSAEEVEDFIEVDPQEEVETEASEPVTSSAAIDDVEVIRFMIRMRTNEYTGLARFAEELDRNDRMLSIDSISYVAPKERVLVEDEQESLEFMMVVSAFYFPSDDEQLEEELPQVEYPKPANKSSPLYNQ
ncbi:hypothetical protein AB3N04_15935 [Alkalihalophilus sp. As8PL]|uniref:Type IV pilus assembly protein PilO n=1 Tax=Alkalihalophilus sp. As8PL TaxID=3237103 RepID=A0AB39BR61_9BACI